MRKLKIVSDSSSDLLKLDNADFDFSPMKILTDEREFVDDRNLDVNEMATYLENYKGKSRKDAIAYDVKVRVKRYDVRVDNKE